MIKLPAQDDPRNWREDAPTGRGLYICRCTQCGESFLGHKRRTVCKLCDGQVSPGGEMKHNIAPPDSALDSYYSFVLEAARKQIERDIRRMFPLIPWERPLLLPWGDPPGAPLDQSTFGDMGV